MLSGMCLFYLSRQGSELADFFLTIRPDPLCAALMAFLLNKCSKLQGLLLFHQLNASFNCWEMI